MAVNRVSITINSRQYTVVAEESREYIERLGEHINEKVKNVLNGGQNVLGNVLLFWRHLIFVTNISKHLNRTIL